MSALVTVAEVVAPPSQAVSMKIMTRMGKDVYTQLAYGGRMSLLGYHYLLIVWDEFESAYQPVYVGRRVEIEPYKRSGSRERLVAAYDLYSESRII